MRKAPVKITEEVTKEKGSWHKKRPECKIKKLKIFGLLLDCLHEIVGVYFESFRKTHVKLILKWVFKKWDDGAWSGLIWLRAETRDGLL
jgi:hypothetical protein